METLRAELEARLNEVTRRAYRGIGRADEDARA
jgi:hypothetical protein